MKKSSLIINAILFVAVAVLYILHFSAPNAKNLKSGLNDSTKVSITPTEGIVYINIDSVLKNYTMFQDVSKELEAKIKTKDAELKSKQRKFEKDVTDFQNKVSKGLVTRAEAGKIEESLKAEQQNLMMLQQKMQYELTDEEQVSQRKMLNSIMEYLKSVEEEQPYQFVLGTSFGGNVLYANDNLNITESVIVGLNEQYEAEKE